MIFALALAEGFKQTVHDKAADPKDPVLYRDKIIGLFSFLFLIIPFYQGTIRFYGHFYSDTGALPNHYSFYIMFDSLAFLCEAALFFLMSRALSPVHWVTFYGAVVTLLWFDTVWVWATTEFHSNQPPAIWVVLNLIFGAAAMAMIFARSKLSNETAVRIGFVGLLARTISDYTFSWNFYFP